MTMTGRRPPTAPASATRRTPREAMAASVLPASRCSGAGGRLSAVEMTEGPFAYCENCTARRAGGGNNMSFSRALSGGTEMQVSASLSAAGAGGGRCSSRYLPVPEPRGELPPPSPVIQSLLCASCHTGEPGASGIVNPILQKRKDSERCRHLPRVTRPAETEWPTFTQ